MSLSNGPVGRSAKFRPPRRADGTTIERGRSVAKHLAVPLLAAGGFGAVLIAGRLVGIPASELTRDVAGVADVPPWTGLLATAGVLVWAAAAAVAVFAACQRTTDRALAPYLRDLGVIAGLLAIDDQFRVSQIVHNATGIPKTVLVSAYGLVLALVLWRHRRIARATGVGRLLAAGAILVAATVLDGLSVRESVEDLLKFTGAAVFAEHVVRTATAARRVDASRSP